MWVAAGERAERKPRFRAAWAWVPWIALPPALHRGELVSCHSTCYTAGKHIPGWAATSQWHTKPVAIAAVAQEHWQSFNNSVPVFPHFISFCPDYKIPCGMLSSFDKEKMKGPFLCIALPPSTQSVPRELNQARCWKLGNEVVNLFPSSYNPFYTRRGLQGPQTTYLSFQSHNLWGVQCTGQTLCFPLHISLLTITHLFCHCMCYKLG